MLTMCTDWRGQDSRRFGKRVYFKSSYKFNILTNKLKTLKQDLKIHHSIRNVFIKVKKVCKRIKGLAISPANKTALIKAE